MQEMAYIRKISPLQILDNNFYYRIILTIDKNNNIIAGSLELIHTKNSE